ncbi:MAG: SDR family oxidoreductase [Hydrogenophilaceae bacterium]|jgi:NAD(P)-dependent dehydrogenase (short-subunit alcohol dehydrogenase family)|nr:SDR family oxidoreductase [Hydrogenophilaceae bacterium]
MSGAAKDGIVLVTGAGVRVGAAIARRLAGEGWTIAAHYRRSKDAAAALAEELGAGAFAVGGDLDDQAAIDAMAAEIGRAGRRWAGVVNCAASFEYDSIADFSFDKALASLRTNLVAPVYLACALARAEAAGDRFVINIADQKITNPNPDFLSYTLAKLTLAHATDTLAMALAPGIRVNCVAPGLMLISGAQTPENFARTHPRTALGRGTTPDDLAGAVAYLAGASAVTGALLTVDCGQHLVRAARDVMFE